MYGFQIIIRLVMHDIVVQEAIYSKDFLKVELFCFISESAYIYKCILKISYHSVKYFRSCT